MPKALINGINVYYEDSGHGFPVLFHHGYAGTTKAWQGQVAAFSQKYRFITFDMRGHGQTDAPADLSRYSLDLMVEDMRQLLGHLGLRKAVIGGLSLGGYLTLHFYDQHPDMAAALIFMDTGPGYRTPESARDWNEKCADRAVLLETRGMKGFMESDYAKQVYYTTPDVMVKHNPIGLANVSRGVMTNPWGLDILPRIQAPSLVVCGDRDEAFLPAAGYMARKIPGARKVIIPNAGHAVNIDQPQLFESTVIDFLDSLELGEG